MLFDRIIPQRRGKVDLNLWVDLYYDAVWNFCRRRVGADLASDATQETFTTAWQKMNAYRTDIAPKTWLFGIAIRHCANLQRKHKPHLALEELTYPGTSDFEGQVLDSHQLNQAMSNLSDDHRRVVMLHELDGLTYDEIAAVLETPVGTVKSRLHHAFQNLRAALYDEEEAR